MFEWFQHADPRPPSSAGSKIRHYRLLAHLAIWVEAPASDMCEAEASPPVGNVDGATLPIVGKCSVGSPLPQLSLQI
jgi:hypothetical protein